MNIFDKYLWRDLAKADEEAKKKAEKVEEPPKAVLGPVPEIEETPKPLLPPLPPIVEKPIVREDKDKNIYLSRCQTCLVDREFIVLEKKQIIGTRGQRTVFKIECPVCHKKGARLGKAE